MSRSLFVTGFDHLQKPWHVAETFERRVGKVKEVEIPYAAGRNGKPYAFVEFFNAHDTNRAIQMAVDREGLVLCRTRLIVRYSNRDPPSQNEAVRLNYRRTISPPPPPPYHPKRRLIEDHHSRNERTNMPSVYRSPSPRMRPFAAQEEDTANFRFSDFKRKRSPQRIFEVVDNTEQTRGRTQTRSSTAESLGVSRETSSSNSRSSRSRRSRSNSSASSSLSSSRSSNASDSCSSYSSSSSLSKLSRSPSPIDPNEMDSPKPSEGGTLDWNS